ncbi:MAG: hypothetical protein ACJ8GN_04045 [Longimicrobiaceae bacterium]
MKSTDGRPGRWAIKLDNWVRLVNAPLPAFLLVLEFDGENECKRAYLVHVGEELIRRALARVRELSVSSPQIPLHTRTLGFRYGVGDALASTNGTELLKGIKDQVGRIRSYVLNKQEILRTAGYERGGQIIEARLRLPGADLVKDPDELLVEWSLGLVPGVTIIPGAEVYDERFGIRYPDPVHIIPTEGRLEPQPVGNGLLRFRTLDGRQERTFAVKMYGSGSLTGYVSEEKLKIRIAAPFGDIFIPIATPTAPRLRFRVPSPDDRISLSELRPLSDFVLLSDTAASSGGLEMELRSDGPPLNVVIDGLEHDEQLTKLAKAIQYALQIATHLGVAKDILTTVNEIFSQYMELELMEAALRGDAMNARVTFSTDETIHGNERVCLPTQIDVRIGDRILAVAVAVIGIPKPTGLSEGAFNEFELPVSAVEVSYKEASEPGEVPVLSRLEMLERVAQQRSDMPVIRWWEHISDEI